MTINGFGTTNDLIKQWNSRPGNRFYLPLFKSKNFDSCPRMSSKRNYVRSYITYSSRSTGMGTMELSSKPQRRGPQTPNLWGPPHVRCCVPAPKFHWVFFLGKGPGIIGKVRWITSSLVMAQYCQVKLSHWQIFNDSTKIWSEKWSSSGDLAVGVGRKKERDR